MKISLITTGKNSVKTLGTTLESVRRQQLDGFELEYIVIDSASTDGTRELIEAFERQSANAAYSFKFVSEADRNLYDGINKGIRMATGDVIGIVNADDVLAEDDTLSKIAHAFLADPKLDAVYADVRFVNGVSDLSAMRKAKSVRYCTGRFFHNWQFRFATFPAHPSTYIRKTCFDKFGLYSLDYSICADFELMLRFFYKHRISARYLPICTTIMRTGGVSTKNMKANIKINQEDLRALKANGVWSCLPLIYLKYFAKVWGLILNRSRPAVGLGFLLLGLSLQAATPGTLQLKSGGQVFAEMDCPTSDVRLRLGKIGDFTVFKLAPAPAATNRVLRRVDLPRIRLRPFASEPMAVGSDGLTKVDGHSGSFGFLTIAEPISRRGVVVGWLTNEKLSGVIASGFADASRREPVLNIFGEYGRMLVKAGEQVPADILVVGAFEDCRLGLEQYADLVAKHYAIKLPKQLAGYTTWYDDKYGYSHKSQRWPEGCGCGTAESALEFAAAVKRHRLNQYGFDFYQIDDHWQTGSANINGPARNFFEIRRDGPFPDGFAAMNAAFAALGVRTGVWFMPFGGLVKEPFFADKMQIFAKSASTYQGRPKSVPKESVGIACNQRIGTPFTTVWGGEVVDMTAPAGRDYVAQLAHRLTYDWGFRYLKYDGIWVGHGGDLLGGKTWRNDHYDQVAWADPTKTGVEALRLGIKTMREASVPGTFLLGCNLAQNQRAMVASFGLTDAMRIGGDNGPIDVFPDRYLAGPIAATPRYFLNGRVWYNDPDPVYVRDAVSLNRARLFASWAGLNGTLYNFSDYLPALSDERVEILKRTLTPHGQLNVRPVDYFEEPICKVWTLQAGRRRVVGLFNWSTNAEYKVDYDFAHLDLKPEATYAGWDFWAKEPMGTFAKRLTITVPPDSCRILHLVETDPKGPVLVSTSRHVASPILETREVESQGNTIKGISKLVKGDACELRFYMPDGRFERRTLTSETEGEIEWRFDL